MVKCMVAVTVVLNTRHLNSIPPFFVGDEGPTCTHASLVYSNKLRTIYMQTHMLTFVESGGGFFYSSCYINKVRTMYQETALICTGVYVIRQD